MPNKAAPRERDAMYQGCCLCGGVRYEITGELGDFGYCHCRWVRASVGQRIAASIPGSRLLLVDDIEHATLAPAVSDFISEPGT